MLYAILCYNSEEIVYSWSQEEDDKVMADLDVVHQKLLDQGRLGPSLRLLPPAGGAILFSAAPPLPAVPLNKLPA